MSDSEQRRLDEQAQATLHQARAVSLAAGHVRQARVAYQRAFPADIALQGLFEILQAALDGRLHATQRSSSFADRLSREGQQKSEG